jgi:hypothetical protein
MGKKLGIWLDHEKAYLISLEGEQVHVETVQSKYETRVRYEGEGKNFRRVSGQMMHLMKKRQERQKHQIKDYFNDIINRFREVDSLYIFGPAKAGKELAKVVEKNKRLKELPLRIEKADHMTENQIVARVRKHFINR